MYSFLAEKLVYPLGDIALRTSVIRYYHWMQKSQWWSSDQICELQNLKLRSLIKHAYTNTEYYHNILKDRGLTYQDFKSLNDLSKLPLLTKNIIRNNFKTMTARDVNKWKPILDATGGSTGEPLKYYITKDLASINWAGMFRGWNWAGYKLGDKRISFGGSSLVPNKKLSFFQLTRKTLERNLLVSAISLYDSKYEAFLNIVNTYHPKFVYGYASALYLFADYCKDNGIKNVKFDAVFSTAEVLLPNYRNTIEEQFNCKVFDQYGSYDGGGQAMECEAHQGFHISAEKVVMQIVDDQGNNVHPGQSGRIIVTDLHNYAMPFIRYEVGDIGILSEKKCICGRGLPILKSLEGRTTDIIKLSNGVILSGLAITHLFANRFIKQFQVIQIANDKLLVKIIKDDNYSEDDTFQITNILKYHAGKEIKIELEFCDTITSEYNSKFRYVISKVQ